MTALRSNFSKMLLKNAKKTKKKSLMKDEYEKDVKKPKKSKTKQK